MTAEFGPAAPCARQALRALQAFEAPGDELAAIRSYYELILKLLAAHALGRLSSGRCLRETLRRIESGVVFRESGIADFSVGSGVGKYLAAWNDDLEATLGEIVRRIAASPLPEEPEDLVKNLYLSLFPPEIRHKLGEYYTPDWLAERLLANTLETDLGNPERRVLDPACGSGTFLVLLIRHIRARAASEKANPRQLLRLILRNVVGFDVNPLAALAARTNYLLALHELLPFRQDTIEIPVFAVDAVLSPPSSPWQKSWPAEGLPNRSRKSLMQFGGADGFACGFRPERLLPWVAGVDWFDYVIGNPPWVNWQSLPEEYRRATRPLWEHYGLFPKRARAMHTILGGAKYDLSMLMTYVAADRYLRSGGRLGFLVSQSLLKSAGAGKGFRRFELPDGTPLAPRLVEDFVQLQPFESAANRTAAIVLQKDAAVQYPVEYQRHNRRTAEHLRWQAQPVSTEDRTSPWICAPASVLKAITRMLGGSAYQAREGANSGGANGVFWLEATSAPSRGTFPVRNLTGAGRSPVAAARTRVEAELVYPLLRGQNVSRWRAEPENWILLTHRPGMKLRAIPEGEMKGAYPRAFSYLECFRSLLSARPAFKRYFKSGAPFYSLFNLGDYTFAPWKVVWREQAWPFTAAVVGRAAGRVVIPDHKLMLVAAGSSQEAHYLCGVLNSLPVSAAVAAYVVEIQISTHVLDNVCVPRFDHDDPLHRALASWSRKAHAAARNGRNAAIQAAETAIDRCSAQLWGFSEDDLAVMRQFLREAGGGSAST